jgi:outer membrane receptor protein involved in Fe transport
MPERKSRWAGVCASMLAACLGAGTVYGQQTAGPAEMVTDAEGERLRITTVVTVTAPTAPRRLEPSADVRTLPSSASVLTARDIGLLPYREPGEVLRALPGMGFTYYGQGGIPSGPTVRGYTDRNFGQDIAGFLDGVPLNLHGFVASHGALDLTVVPPEVLDRVELVRGPIEARYGDFNRGGTLNLVVRDGVSQPALAASGGSFGTWNVTGEYGNLRTAERTVSLYSVVGTQGTGGYADNQDRWHNRLFNRVLVPLPVGDLTLTALNGWSRWNAPGYLDKAAVVGGAVDERAAVNPTDGGRLQHNLLAVRYRAGAQRARPFEATAHVGTRDWQRWRQDALLGPTQPQVQQVDDRTTWGFRADQTWGQFVGARPLLVSLGAAVHRADAATRQARTELRQFVAWNDDVDEVLTDVGVYAQGQVGLTDHLKAVGGLRYSRVSYDIQDNLRPPGQFVPEYSAGQWQPKVGVVFAPRREVELYANYVVGMRSPTPRTEVRNSLGSVDRIQIARTESYEVGATFRPLRSVDVDATWWRADNSNEIRGIPPGGVQFESLGRSRRHGASVDVRCFLPHGARVTGGVSWVNASLLTPTVPAATHLPDIPDYVHQVGVMTPLGAPGSTPGRFSAVVDLFFYGWKHLNTLGTIRSDRYERGSFRLAFTPGSRHQVWLGGFFYPGSRFGESEYLFGSRVGVRPNPRVSVDGGVAVRF